jgi:hypothetical protein
MALRQSLLLLPHIALSFLLLHFLVFPKQKCHRCLSGREFSLENPSLSYDVSICPCRLSLCRYAANAQFPLDLPSTVNFSLWISWLSSIQFTPCQFCFISVLCSRILKCPFLNWFLHRLLYTFEEYILPILISLWLRTSYKDDVKSSVPHLKEYCYNYNMIGNVRITQQWGAFANHCCHGKAINIYLCVWPCACVPVCM